MTSRLIQNCTSLLILLWALSTHAAELQSFSNEELRERYIGLINELRCPQCQNQNLQDSDSPIAQDLRRTVVRLLESGKSDKEITDYLIDRYGDFITYMPRFQRGTYALWLTPAVLAILAIFLVLVILRRQRVTRGNDVAKPLSGAGSDVADGDISAAERERLNSLLAPKKVSPEEGQTDNKDTTP